MKLLLFLSIFFIFAGLIAFYITRRLLGMTSLSRIRKFAVGLNQPFVSGLHKYKNTHIYLSQGTGYWGPPVRVGAPSEITLIKLRPFKKVQLLDR